MDCRSNRSPHGKKGHLCYRYCRRKIIARPIRTTSSSRKLFWLDERVGKEKNYDGAISYLEKLHKAGVPIIWHPFIGLTREEISLEIVSHEQTIIALQESLRFDIIITSSGEDGHVASLFPHSIALQEKEPKYLFVENVPKPPPLRISASPGLLLTADDAFLFIVGDKKPAYNAFVNPAVPVTQCPAKLLQDLPQLIVFVCVK